MKNITNKQPARHEYNMDALQALADTPDICTYISDFHTGEILMCNNAYAGFFGFSFDTAIGTRCYENMGYASRCSFCPYDKLLKPNGDPAPPYSWEHHFEHCGITLHIINRAVRWLDGRLANMTVGINISQRKKIEDNLYNLAYFDKTLKIPNNERMEQDMRENRSYEYLIALNLTDVGRINNIFGRTCGDEVLQMVCDYILEMNIPNSTIYRGKVSDFFILIKNICDLELPQKAAERIYNRCQTSWDMLVDNQHQNIFTAADVCVISLDFHHEHFFSYLYSIIGHSLKIARQKDNVVICDANLRKSFDTDLKLENCIKNAVRNNMSGFHVEYQPIIDARTEIWKGLEALCRWNSSEFGPVPPSEFIPMAEVNGLIGIIGLWVLEQSIVQVKHWGLDAIEGFLLDVNLSPVQLAITDLDKIIEKLLKKHNFPPEKLGLEITESNEMNFSKHTMDAIVRLSESGVSIVLDDFGTGYSSFNTLYKLPVKVLKTDRSFIKGIESDIYLQNLISIMVDLAHGFDIKIMAEGVENNTQAQFLLSLGVDFIQGYFYSHPLPVKKLEEKLDNFFTVINK